MPDSTAATIEVAAPPPRVLDVIADVAAYPTWAETFTKVVVLSEDGDGWPDQVEFAMESGPIKDTYVLEYDWQVSASGAAEVSWHLVRATLLKALTGRYTLAAHGRGTRVTYALEVDLAIPMIGTLKRRAERVVIETALSSLKARVEGEA